MSSNLQNQRKGIYLEKGVRAGESGLTARTVLPRTAATRREGSWAEFQTGNPELVACAAFLMAHRKLRQSLEV